MYSCIDVGYCKIQGREHSYLTFYASQEIPLHICQTSNADQIYKKHFGQQLLKVCYCLFTMS